MSTTAPNVPTVEPAASTTENESLADRLYTVRYDDAGDSHLDVTIPGICAEKCHSNECVEVCPANVWREGEEGVPEIAYENCLECGSCRWACPHGNVEWSYPTRGKGVSYKKG